MPAFHAGTTSNSLDTCATTADPSSMGGFGASLPSMYVDDIRFYVDVRLHLDHHNEVGASEPASDKGGGAECVPRRSGRARGCGSRVSGPNLVPRSTACGCRVGRDWGGRMRWMGRQRRRCGVLKRRKDAEGGLPPADSAQSDPRL